MAIISIYIRYSKDSHILAIQSAGLSVSLGRAKSNFSDASQIKTLILPYLEMVKPFRNFGRQLQYSK